MNREDFIAWMERIMDRFEIQDKKIDRLTKQKSVLDGDGLLDNQDLAILLKVNHRTLARYRKKKILPYFKIEGRCYYKVSDVHNMVRNYLP